MGWGRGGGGGGGGHLFCMQVYIKIHDFVTITMNCNNNIGGSLIFHVTSCGY